MSAGLSSQDWMAAMPIEMVAWMLRVFWEIAKGSEATRRRSRSATKVATPTSVSGMTTTNSSPPIAAGEIDAAHRLPQPLGELLEHVVAGGMAVGVVDGLEEVDVEHQHA